MGWLPFCLRRFARSRGSMPSDSSHHLSPAGVFVNALEIAVFQKMVQIPEAAIQGLVQMPERPLGVVLECVEAGEVIMGH